jgi:transposase
VDLVTAWTILAELGSDMSVFFGPKHAASWAGLCPGNHESGGKRLSNRTRKGNRWLRRALCQSAWAATRKKNCYLAALAFRPGSSLKSLAVYMFEGCKEETSFVTRGKAAATETAATGA